MENINFGVKFGPFE